MEFFATNAPDPLHWTLNSCFGEFCTIWVHLGPFGSLTKLGAIRAELVQKFVPRSRIRIFRNEPTRSTPFGCICDHSVALRNSGKRFELVQKFVARRCVGGFRYEHTRSTPLDSKLTVWCVSYYLGAFGTVLLPYETRCKTGRTSAKLRNTKSRQNFSQRTYPIHHIGP